MKQLFIILAVVGLVACQQDKPEIHIMGTQFDFAQDEGVDDSLVYGEYEPDIDSVDVFGPDMPGEIDPIDTLQNVGELLDYLETIPINE